jgi:hypothetical protein
MAERHVADGESEFVVVCVTPDFCKVGKYVVPFNSFQELSSEKSYITNVKARGERILTVGSAIKGTQGNAGSGIVSGTGLGRGDCVILTGADSVKASGMPVACHGSLVAMNNSNAFGRLYTMQRAFAPKSKEDLQQDWENYSKAREYHAQEADKLSEKIDEAKQQLSDTSFWDRSECNQIKDRIAKLEEQRGFHDRSVAYYSESMGRATEGPVMTAPPSEEVEASFGRMQAEKDRKAAKEQALANLIGIALSLGGRGRGGVRPVPRKPAAKPKPAPTPKKGGVFIKQIPPSKDPRYARGTFRKGVREEVWENAKGPDGKVRDPVTGKEMNYNEPWDMGHKPGHEHWKHQQSAAERGLTRQGFLNEYNNPSKYRPELPSSNRSHAGELKTNVYFGP